MKIWEHACGAACRAVFATVFSVFTELYWRDVTVNVRGVIRISYLEAATNC